MLTLPLALIVSTTLGGKGGRAGAEGGGGEGGGGGGCGGSEGDIHGPLQAHGSRWTLASARLKLGGDVRKHCHRPVYPPRKGTKVYHAAAMLLSGAHGCRRSSALVAWIPYSCSRLDATCWMRARCIHCRSTSSSCAHALAQLLPGCDSSQQRPSSSCVGQRSMGHTLGVWPARNAVAHCGGRGGGGEWANSFWMRGDSFF